MFPGRMRPVLGLLQLPFGFLPVFLVLSGLFSPGQPEFISFDRNFGFCGNGDGLWRGFGRCRADGR